jgi:hypothetical protein
VRGAGPRSPTIAGRERIGTASHGASGALVTAGVAEHAAFGFRIEGMASTALTGATQPDWPRLRVRRRVGPVQHQPAHLSEGHAHVELIDDGWLSLDRGAATATYLSDRDIDPDRLVHPLLSPAAGLMARWLGREAFHCGAFLAAGGAWGLTGANEAGKSTILATMARSGTPVLTDDLLVVDRAGTAYAGPRCIDLRELDVVGGDVAAHVRTVRSGTRQRLALAPVQAAAPLRGWFFLDWGDAVEAQPCSARERFRRLGEQRRWPMLPADPRALLDLASLPAWTLRRPRGAQHMPAVLACLARATARHAVSGGAR